MRCGFDCGTFNLVCCTRNEKKDFVYKREVNAFIQMPLENDFMVNMMRTSKVPLILRQDAGLVYALGEKAVTMAYSMGLELRRPMKDGCVNPKEHDAFELMNLMIHGLVGEVTDDQSILYYCVPSNAVNAETDAAYHGKIVEAIFKAYKSKAGHTVKAYPINEALAIVYAELAEKMYTGIGISFGGGMVNVCPSPCSAFLSSPLQSSIRATGSTSKRLVLRTRHQSSSTGRRKRSTFPKLRRISSSVRFKRSIVL
jgi:actin-like ATPase involved in cell morphogenesis